MNKNGSTAGAANGPAKYILNISVTNLSLCRYLSEGVALHFRVGSIICNKIAF